MDSTTNSLNWFDIPAKDLEKSKKFYETIFDIKMDTYEMEGTKMAFFPMSPDSGKATGCIAQGSNYTPSMQGTIVYLNANPKMDPVLAKVEPAGGKITLPKTSIGEFGFMAFIQDTEGNNVGLHSME